MADVWVTDLTHFLDEHGAMADMPAPAQRLATYFASIVAAASNEDYYDEDSAMVVHCRRRPGRKPCSGEILAFIEPEHNDILWQCPLCKDKPFDKGVDKHCYSYKENFQLININLDTF